MKWEKRGEVGLFFLVCVCVLFLLLLLKIGVWGLWFAIGKITDDIMHCTAFQGWEKKFTRIEWTWRNEKQKGNQDGSLKGWWSLWLFFQLENPNSLQEDGVTDMREKSWKSSSHKDQVENACEDGDTCGLSPVRKRWGLVCFSQAFKPFSIPSFQLEPVQN